MDVMAGTKCHKAAGRRGSLGLTSKSLKILDLSKQVSKSSSDLRRATLSKMAFGDSPLSNRSKESLDSGDRSPRMTRSLRVPSQDYLQTRRNSDILLKVN